MKDSMSFSALGRAPLWALAVSSCLMTGCALLSKAEPLSPRYFSPEPSVEPAGDRAPPVRADLRLGNVDAAAYLDERIAYRPSETELGYFEDQRWTEPPAAYLRRALTQELFERRGLSRIVGGAAPTLDAELVSFEELREGARRARVSLRFTLRDERRALLEHTLVVERPIAPGDDAAARGLTLALSKALEDAVAQVADQVVGELQKAP